MIALGLCGIRQEPWCRDRAHRLVIIGPAYEANLTLGAVVLSRMPLHHLLIRQEEFVDAPTTGVLADDIADA
jgi:hypothetical protein